METTGSVFLSHSVKKLEQMTSHLDVCLAKLSEDQIWSRGAEHENSVGNLILHLCGNVRQWILHGVGGEPDVRQRDAEFASNSAMPLAALKDHLHTTVNQAIAVIRDLPEARLTEKTTPQHDEVFVLGAIYQVVGHFQQHTGQIIYATKQMVSEGLGIYVPPKK